MNMSQAYMLLQAVFWILCILGYRKKICKRIMIWTIPIGVIGIIFLYIGIELACMLAYSNGLINTKYDLKVIIDAILLRNPHEQISTIETFIFAGDSTVIAALSIPIICKFFRETEFPEIGHKILLALLYAFVAMLIGMLVWIVVASLTS